MTHLNVEQAMQIAVGHHQSGRLAEAETIYRQILAQQPERADALHLLGVIAHQTGRNDAAVELISSAIRLHPFYAAAHLNLGNALKAQGKFEAAIASYRQAIALKPSCAAYSNLGVVLRDQRKFDEAVAAHRQAVQLDPANAESHINLAVALIDQGNLDPAIAECKTAIALKPTIPHAYTNLGNAYKDQGLLDAALANFDRVLELAPGDANVASNRVYTMHFHPGFDASTILGECRKWDQTFAQPLKGEIKPHANLPDPNRRLKIGFISPDWTAHPVGRFMLPLLARLDRRQVEITAYSDVVARDEMTAILRGVSDRWRDITGQSDQSVASLIREDGIDILVDLTMHMAGNRLLVFARKPAPVQVTYLAYCSTTGLAAIDYRLTDPYLDPPAKNAVEPNAHYSETSVWLPRTYWCYRPAADAPDVGPLPAQIAGHTTFGCLNNFCKVSDHALLAWLRLMRETPGSRLILHVREGSHRQRLLETARREGIEADRMTLVGSVTILEYFRLYNRIDIGLDPFPYGGGTTTCDAMWMGVPVVSLAGTLAVGRSGASLLGNVGLTHLLCRSANEYVQTAANLARELPALAPLRHGLRDRMRQSPLMDEPGFARDMESAFRGMWRRYCATARGSGGG